MNEIPKGINEKQLKIDALSPIVKRYMSLEFALGSEVLDEGDKQHIKGEMDKMMGRMRPKFQEELLLHKIWLKKQTTT